MWMTAKDRVEIDFAAARDEGIEHADDIASNYADQIGLSRDEMRDYLTNSISYTPDDSMLAGMELYFQLAHRHELIDAEKPTVFL